MTADAMSEKNLERVTLSGGESGSGNEKGKEQEEQEEDEEEEDYSPWKRASTYQRAPCASV